MSFGFWHGALRLKTRRLSPCHDLRIRQLVYTDYGFNRFVPGAAFANS